MTATAPLRLCDLIETHPAAWRGIMARCDTDQPLTPEDGAEILTVVEDALGVYLLLVQQWVRQSLTVLKLDRRSAQPTLKPGLDQLTIQAEQVTTRLRDLEERLCCRGTPSNQSLNSGVRDT